MKHLLYAQQVCEDAASWVLRVLSRLLRIAYICGALLILVLGAHGVYVHVSPWETGAKLASEGEGVIGNLFLSVATPSTLSSWVRWMSFKGAESWFIPACFVVGGLLLIVNRDKVRWLLA